MNYKNKVKKLNEIIKTANSSFVNVIKIGFPLTPCEVKNIFENDGWEIILSYGGGMGGTRETLNVITDITDDMLKSDFFTCQTICGKTVTVYTRFVVTVRKVIFVTIQGEHQNKNFIEQGNKFVSVHKVYENNVYMIVNQYVHDSKGDDEILRKFYN
jgi:hypothetical protein